MDKSLAVAAIIAASTVLGACSSSSSDAPPPPPADNVVPSSSLSSSGSTSTFSENGITYAVTPSSAGGSAKLVSIPNSGSELVGVISVTAISALPITTSLTTSIDGTAIDPVNKIGLGYGYGSGDIAFFSLSTTAPTELSTFKTGALSSKYYSGGAAFIPGAIIDPNKKCAIVAASSGFEIISYADPKNPSLVRAIASEDNSGKALINENFGYHPSLPLGGTKYAMILTGSGSGYNSADYSNNPPLQLIDADTGIIYNPDSATTALFTAHTTQYTDHIAVDTNYHVAILASEFDGNFVVNLNQLSLDAASGTFTLPSSAVIYIDDYNQDGTQESEYTNLAIESTNHYVMMGQGFYGSKLVVGQLSDPAVSLGFTKLVMIDMPVQNDDKGVSVSWSGSADPHGTGAYVTAADHPSYTNNPTSLGVWASGLGTHLAIIDIKGILDAGSYDANASPRDIAYFKIP